MSCRRSALSFGVLSFGISALLLALPAVGAAAPGDEVGGTGRIEPRGGVVQLGGVTGAIIKNINVHVGDSVKRGDLLVTLEGDSVRAERDNAQLAFNQTQLVSRENIANERLAVKLAEDRWKRAQSDADAYRALGPNATSQRQIAQSDSAADEAKVALATERSHEKQIRAAADVDTQSAARRLKVADDKLATYEIRAPSDGTILRVDQHAGEAVAGPVLELGDISVMYVAAQIFQGDLLKLKPGMKARINNSVLGRELTGTIERVSRLIDTKAQLGDVRIRLDDTNLASRVVGMEVQVKIAP